MKMFLFAICLIISGCDCSSSNIEGPTVNAFIMQASSLEDRLRDHFMGRKTYEVSGLIAETRVTSNSFKRMKYYAIANKFDSYTDVLMYGNRTLAESMNDVMNLVRGHKATTAIITKNNEESDIFSGLTFF